MRSALVRLAATISVLMLCVAHAAAQSTCPYIVTNAVLTAAQWNFCFSSKQNSLGYQPVNRSGDVMTGKLVTAGSTTTISGLNLPHGTAPTSPTNGDLWTTTSGVFARVNGSTVGPFLSAGTTALTSAHIFVGNGSNLATDVALSQDCTLTNTGAITCTKTNNVSFAASATTDTTNASNISFGTLALARGGLGAGLTASNGGIFYSTATAGAVLPGIATANLPMLSGSSAAPTWASIVYPTTANSGGLAYFVAANSMASSAVLAANQLVLGGGAGTAPATLGSLGTTTTVLHGNASGAPSFGAVALGTDVSGSLPCANTSALTGVVTTSAGSCATVGPVSPQTRLTAQSGVPVQTADQSGVTAVYVAPFTGQYLPVRNAADTGWTQVSVTSSTTDAVGLTLNLNTTDHVANVLYEVFVGSDAGTTRACTGPSFTNNGAGTSARSAAGAVAEIDKIKVNSISMTCRYTSGGTPSSFTCGAHLCTAVGVLKMTASGQTSMVIRPTAVSGGNNTNMYVCNHYNQVLIRGKSQDSTSTWEFGSTTTRPANNSNSNRINFLDCTGQRQWRATYATSMSPKYSTPDAATIGVGLNINNNFSGGAGAGAELEQAASNHVSVGGPLKGSYSPYPIFGYNFVQAMEQTTDGACTPATFTGTGSGTNLTASSVTGAIWPQAIVAGTGVPAGTVIISQSSGTPQGAGVYVTSVATTSSGAALTASGPCMFFYGNDFMRLLLDIFM